MAIASLRPRAAGLLIASWLVLCGPPAWAELDLDAIEPFAGRRITAVELEGHRVTLEPVIRRELRSLAGEPLHVETVAADVQRLENLSIFAEIGVHAQADGDGVRMTVRVKEMPAYIPWVGFSYT